MRPEVVEVMAEALRRDLSVACAHLLDRYAAVGGGGAEEPEGTGGSSFGRARRGGGGPAPLGPLGLALRGATTLVRHLPLALEQLELDPIGGEEAAVHVAVPRRAAPSRSAADYAGTAGTGLAGVAAAMPRTWWSWTPAGRPPRGAVAWLLAVVEGYRARLAEHVQGLEDAIDEAIAFRGARSAHGLDDVARIEGFERTLLRTDATLAAARSRLIDLGGHGLVASRRLPAPFPRGASWATLRGLWLGIDDARAAAAAIARELVQRREVGVDVAYLYQRWCGWRLVQALESLGWKPKGDPLPPLLLSGAVEFERAGSGKAPDVLELLCEPRLASKKAPVHGITAAVGELTPDYVLLTRGPAGLDAHVLDPTLSLGVDHRRSKRKYLRHIQVEGTRVVAGVRVVAGPLRSWAAAPLTGTRCVIDLEDWRGTHGTVPMNPVEYRGEALVDWLRELG